MVQACHWVGFPKLTKAKAKALSTFGGPFITRHWACCDDESRIRFDQALGGALWFGTAQGYRGTGQESESRFSDPFEGGYNPSFHSPDGKYDQVRIGGISFNGCEIHSTRPHVSIEYLADEFVCCSSDGGFSKERAQVFKDKGNPTLNRYIVYNTRKLLLGLRAAIAEFEPKGDWRIVTQKVAYAAKDPTYVIGPTTNMAGPEFDLKKWQEILFVKPIDFEHEEDVRIVILDRNRSLHSGLEEKGVLVKHARIQASIEESGWIEAQPVALS